MDPKLVDKIIGTDLKPFEKIKFFTEQFKLIPGTVFQFRNKQEENKVEGVVSEDVGERIYKKIAKGKAVHIVTGNEIDLKETTPVRSLLNYEIKQIL